MRRIRCETAEMSRVVGNLMRMISEKSHLYFFFNKRWRSKSLTVFLVGGGTSGGGGEKF